jgi:hypothetical protein
MMPIPGDILAKFDAALRNRAVPAPLHGHYRKWLRYFLDFRNKYPLPDSRSEQVRLFIEKLKSRKQTPQRQSQAAHALSLFFETMGIDASQCPTRPAADTISSKVSEPAKAPSPSPAWGEGNKTGSRFNEWQCLEKSDSPAWDEIIDKLAAEIKTRHYSRKTLKTYADWSRKGLHLAVVFPAKYSYAHTGQKGASALSSS